MAPVGLADLDGTTGTAGEQHLNAVLRRLYELYLRGVMPLVGWLFHGDADTYAYIPESLERYPAQRGVEALMREAGFVEIAVEDLMLGTMAFHVATRPAEGAP